MRSWRYLLDGDAKVKWAHDEVIIGCLMLIAHPPNVDQTADGAWAGETSGESTVEWATRTLQRVRAYADHAFSLAHIKPGSWKVGGDRHAKPDPDANGVSGYNMGCTSLPNRVEHYHHPRMLMNAIRLCDTVIKTGGSWKCA